MSRGGRKKDQDEQERRCIVTGETDGKYGMIRFVLGPDQTVVPDLAEKLPGRGIWVTSGRDELDKAVARNLFSRAAKSQAVLPGDLVQMVEDALARRVIDMISMARKAGLAIAGYEKVKDWLSRGQAKVLLQAVDGSERGKGRLWTPEGGRWFGCLTAQEMGLAFGRSHVIHSALAPGGLTKKVIRDAGRLSGLRGHDGSLIDTAGKGSKTV